MRFLFAILTVVAVAPCSRAQWELENSHTHADLRGVDNARGAAWASGTNGTVLRTTDGGGVWQSCAIPPGAEHLDFRGIQALDEHTAIVMSSGKGELSRLYKTVDGCRTWRLLFTNPDKDGFWDAILHDARLNETYVLGDPVDGSFVLYWSGGDNHPWSKNWNSHSVKAFAGQAVFAASNSILIRGVSNGELFLVTGGSRSELVHARKLSDWSRSSLPFAAGESSGAFSVASDGVTHVVITGGDYRQPNRREGTAAYSTDGRYHFLSAQTPPAGYRSAVAYDGQHKTWITVGPNGTDISRDDGRNWRPLGPIPEDAPGSDRDWNALSLPFVVGPHGRIGKLHRLASALR